MVFTFKFTYFLPQTVTLTPFKDAIPAILHLKKFGLRPEYFKQKENISSNYLADAKSLRHYLQGKMLNHLHKPDKEKHIQKLYYLLSRNRFW